MGFSGELHVFYTTIGYVLAHVCRVVRHVETFEIWIYYAAKIFCLQFISLLSFVTIKYSRSMNTTLRAGFNAKHFEPDFGINLLLLLLAST